MCDKVIILSEIPAIIKNIYDIKLENKTTTMEKVNT